MDGVTILNINYEVTHPFIWAFFVGLFFIVLGFGMLNSCSSDNLRFTGIIVIILGFLIMILSLFVEEEQTDIVKSYDVLVDDTVTMNEFLEHYNIKYKNGLIYTVTDKENHK